jgi:hypothetical protein
MSKRSDAVKTWRQNTKQRIVESMGGKCQLCGYARCNDALELHHIDPSQKDFTMGGIRANPIAWARIVVELRKCVLLCANCHREVEAGHISLPETATSSFNEEFVEYTLGVSPRSRNVFEASCRYCGNSMPSYSSLHTFCSDVCAKKSNSSSCV